MEEIPEAENGLSHILTLAGQKYVRDAGNLESTGEAEECIEWEMYFQKFPVICVPISRPYPTDLVVGD